MGLRRCAPVLGFLATGLATGCAMPEVPTTVDTTGMPSAELALQRSMAQVNVDMAQIGAMHPTAYAAQETAGPVMPDELTKPVRFVWSGELDTGVRKLAESIGYRVAIYAPKNARPISVTVNSDGQVVGAFRSLGEQAGTAATVELDPLHHQVDVVHHV